MIAKAEPITIKNYGTPERTTEKIREELRNDLAEWMTTNEDLVWRPVMELSAERNEFVAKALISAADPENVEVMIAPEMMLVKANINSCNGKTKLLASVKFPWPVDPKRARAEIEDGMLHVRVKMANAALEVVLPRAA